MNGRLRTAIHALGPHEVIEGHQNGFKDCSKREFQTKAMREVKD
jgi:hypothetical protein